MILCAWTFLKILQEKNKGGEENVSSPQKQQKPQESEVEIIFEESAALRFGADFNQQKLPHMHLSFADYTTHATVRPHSQHRVSPVYLVLGGESLLVSLREINKLL